MNHLVIDVREPSEFARGHVDGAINIPPERIMSGVQELHDVAKDTPIILYCVSGARSNMAGNILRGYGFTNITNGINKDHTKKLLKKL